MTAPDGRDVPTVVIVDDDVDVRRAFEVLLSGTDYKVRSFETAREYLDAYEQGEPGCLVLDVRLPDGSGLELQEEMVERRCVTPIIVISGYADVSMAVRALEAGAVAFIEKPFRRQEILGRIEEAILEDTRLRQVRSHRDQAEERLGRLTPREREILRLVASGKMSKEIAFDLDISERTVESHRAHLMKKTQADSLADLVALAIECGVREI